jgi:mono/diheme cytochrome c family protein
MNWLVGAAVAAPLLAVAAAGQQTTEVFVGGSSGADVYKTYCASCHGTEARGDGPLADHLRHAPSDLTTFAKRNGDKFDAAKMHRIIDGRDPVKGHGGPDMPVWGDALKRSSEGYSEDAVREKINALVAHLKSLQRK